MYIPSYCLYTVFRLLENTIVKLPHPWHDPIINPTCRTAPQNLPPSAMKSIYKKVPPPCFFGGDTMPLLHW